MTNTARSFCRGFGSVMEVQPRTYVRHRFISPPNNRRVVAEHFQDCWQFVTDSLHEAALEILADDGLVADLSEYLKQCSTPSRHQQTQNPNGYGESCRLHESKGQLDLCCLDRWMREASEHGTNGHRSGNR